MLTRVETLKRNGIQQVNYFKTFDERLQRLEDMQTLTLQLLNNLMQKMPTLFDDQTTLIESNSSKTLDRKSKEIEDEEILNFVGVPSSEDISRPMSSLLSTRSMHHSSSYTARKATNPSSIPISAPSQSVTGSYSAMKNSSSSALTTNDERLAIGTATLSTSSSSLNMIDDTNRPDLHEAEEAEHNIYGKLIKERFRKLSEVVEDIERTLPSHQQHFDNKSDKCDITDDDETLSTIDWVDTNGLVAYNSTRVSYFDINQDENENFIATSNI